MNRKGFVFTPYTPPEMSIFDRLFDIFKELITHTSGDLMRPLIGENSG
jgi:Ca-activated chloride channel family protein